MTPVGFVFLTLMFGVIIPAPTHGRVKMTFGEVLSMTSSALEKRQGGDPKNAGEYAALLTFTKCLEKLGQGTDTPCNDAYLAKANRKLLNLDAEDTPLEDWVRVSKLKCLDPLVCNGVCACRPPPDYGNPVANSRVTPCPRVERDPRVRCTKEYRAYHQFLPPRTPPTQNVLHVQLRNHGVSISISGWLVAIAISRCLLFSP